MEQPIRPEQQSEVVRLVGRCVLRLQQYERLLKAILANHHLGGTVRDMEAKRAARVEKFSGMTLGTLVKELFDNYVVVDGDERPVLDDGKLPQDQCAFGYRFSMQVTAEHRAQVKAAVEELVTVRNELVHHFMEQFDVWSDAGCAAAVQHLNATFDRIDGHFNELRGWATTMDEARAEMGAFMRSAEYEALVLDGIAPDGTFDWPHTGIVRALRSALRARHTEGWSRLDEAKAWMAETSPGQVPGKYRCTTWPQVLHESKCFQLEYRTDTDGQRLLWYRARE